jgi:predicted murein hydrolase (TIGR00659 family)
VLPHLPSLLPTALVSGPLLWLPLTIAAFLLASDVYCRAGKPALLNPTLLTIVCVSVALAALQVPYRVYFESVAVLHYLLGTAVVALAVPLHQNMKRLRGKLRPIALALLVGSVTSIASGIIIARALGVSAATLLSLAPKSATAAVSMQIAEGIGGVPAVAACLTIATGIIGAVLGPYVLTLAGVRSPRARGVALGTASHGIATARAFNESELAGCCASLAMGLNAVLTAALVPLILMLLPGGR